MLGGFVATTAASLFTMQSAAVEPDVGGAPINPPSLSEPAPADRSLVADDATLYLCLKANPRTLNPILMSSDPDNRVRELIYDPLFTFNDRLEWAINDALVESYRESDDHLSAELKLRDGATWHDGRPFTADDVVFSYQQIMDDRVPCPAARTGTDQIVSCDAPDRLTVRFRFARAMPTNRWYAAVPVIPRHIYEQHKAADPTLTRDEYYVKQNREPIGNGPYRFVRWLSDDRIELARWDGYRGPRPHFDRVILRIVPDPSARLRMFERGLIHEFETTPLQFARETDSEGFRAVGVRGTAPQWKYIYICWNQDGSNPFFADRDVRRAICRAIDYDRILQQAYDGLYERSHGIHHSSAPMFNPQIGPFEFDLNEAAAMLDRAGWIRSDDDGWRYKTTPTPNGDERKRFQFTLNVPAESATSPAVAAIIQNDLAKIGVQMETRSLEFSTFTQMNREHQFEAAISAWSFGKDPDDEWNLWRTESYRDGRNYGGYSNARVDELFEKARQCFDERQRTAHYAEISRIIYDDAPYAFIANVPTLWAFNRHIRGVAFSPRGPVHFFPGVRNWWTHRNDPVTADD
ncbi:MAG: hypothetical protein HOP29_12780 [Phycisphaerales bacterium]|nr:hypothetical protein [Phycisphaerales bacterium]